MTASASGPSLILASASPRRRELLEQIGLSFQVLPVDIDETPRPGEAADLYVLRMAREKALACQRDCDTGNALVLGADTSVVLERRIMGKPRDRRQARAMLERLSGRRHQVMSGVALAAGDAVRERVVSTTVTFRRLSEAEIEAYLATGEPWDKAGAYGIQGRGGVFVDRIEGSYSAVVGLPVETTADLLAQSGQPVWNFWRSYE